MSSVALKGKTFYLPIGIAKVRLVTFLQALLDEPKDVFWLVNFSPALFLFISELTK